MILFNELWNWLCLNSIILEKVIDANVDFKNESYNYQSIHQKKGMKTIWTTLFLYKEYIQMYFNLQKHDLFNHGWFLQYEKLLLEWDDSNVNANFKE